MVIFHSYVSLPEGNHIATIITILIHRSWAFAVALRCDSQRNTQGEGRHVAPVNAEIYLFFKYKCFLKDIKYNGH